MKLIINFSYKVYGSTTSYNSTYIACRTFGSLRQEIVTLSIVNINKHKGINAARNIAAGRCASCKNGHCVQKKILKRLE